MLFLIIYFPQVHMNFVIDNFCYFEFDRYLWRGLLMWSSRDRRSGRGVAPSNSSTWLLCVVSTQWIAIRSLEFQFFCLKDRPIWYGEGACTIDRVALFRNLVRVPTDNRIHAIFIVLLWPSLANKLGANISVLLLAPSVGLSFKRLIVSFLDY